MLPQLLRDGLDGDGRGVAGDERGDQGLDGEVVDRAGDAAAGLVDEAERVVAEDGVASAGELEVVADVADGLLQVHAVQVVAQGDALVQGGQGAELEPAAQGGLAQQQTGKGLWASMSWL